MQQTAIDTAPINIDGEPYHTIAQFAHITNRSESSVRVLVSKGNRVRILKTVYFGGKPFIPRDELTAFPFTCAGRALRIYHYLDDGSVVYDDGRTETKESE